MSALQGEASLREPLLLPEIVPIPYHPSAVYGAARVAAAYCGLRQAPDHIRGIWQHGWNASFQEMNHPDLIMGIAASPEMYLWVGREDQRERLESFGYKNVAAIGLPMVYLPPRVIHRRPGSLLVMPAHSLEYTTHRWKFDEYAETISSIRDNFSEVVVCIHPSCWKHGYWIDAFRKRDFPLVVGAGLNDGNGLERIRHLLSSFEYVTTNGFGSQLAYGAYFGAKPSIFGPFASYRPEDFKNDPLFQKHPALIGPTLDYFSEEALRAHYPHLFCHPRKANANVEWGRSELGEPNKVSPRKLQSLFGWTVSARATRSVVARTPDRVKKRVRMILQPSFREEQREIQRLWKMPPHQPTRTSLLGRSLEVLNAPRFMAAKIELFDQELYRFNSNEDIPRILVCGAGIGLSVCYFKQLYPKSEIVAFEPNPQVYEVLKRNCTSWGADDIRLIPKAVWTCETTLPFLVDGYCPGRVTDQCIGDDSLRVPTCRLRDYLTHKIDLLLLNIEGAEVDVLLDCADLLGQVQNLVVVYHSLLNRSQRLDDLMGLLTRSGFRFDFRASILSPSPLLYRASYGGIYSKLHIFAFRE